MSGAMVSFSCEVPAADVKAFTDALNRYEKETKRDMRGAVRSSAIDLVKSLRARTRKAPKVVPRSDVRFGESDPKYITGTRPRTRGTEFRRVVVTRWSNGRKRQQVEWQPVRAKLRTRRGGFSVVESKEAMLRSARETFGKIRQWGLAKKSWGWFMHALFGKSVPNENPQARIDGRRVEGAIQERGNEISVEMANKLKYVRKALQPGALSASLRAAANSINKKITAGLLTRRFGA